MNKDRDMNIVVLPGDGAGPEVSAEAVKCLELLSDHCGLDLRFETLDFGGAAIDTAGSPLPDSTLAACKGADAVLMGAVGGPRWDGRPEMPEAGLLKLPRAWPLRQSAPGSGHPRPGGAVAASRGCRRGCRRARGARAYRRRPFRADEPRVGEECGGKRLSRVW